MATRLLVVGASSMRGAAFSTWQRMGLEIVLVDGFSTARYEELVDEFVADDPRDGLANVDAIADLARSCDGVTTLADDSQATVAAVAEKVGLPGVGRAAGEASRSKVLQRSMYERIGMLTPRWRAVRGADDLRDFYNADQGAAVMKPVDATGGAGALPVNDLAEAIRQWPVTRSLSPSNTAIIEDYIEGREICVEAAVLGHVPEFVSITEADHLDSAGFVCVSGRIATVQDDHATAVEATRQLVSALALESGLIHAEFKITDRGWVVLETALRPGGAFVPELTQRVTGVNLYEVQALLALGDSRWVGATPAKPVAPHAQSRYLVASGQVRRFAPPAHIVSRYSYVRIVHQQVMPGQTVRSPLSDGGRAGYVLGWGTDPRVLSQQVDDAAADLCEEIGLTMLGQDTMRA